MSDLNGIDAIIDKVFNSFRKISPALIAIAIVTAIVLFAPDSFLAQLGLDTLSQNVTIVIGLVFLLSAVLILAIMFSYLFEYLRKKQIINEKIRDCRLLNDKQKAIMKRLLIAKDRSDYLKATDGDVVFLKSKGLICRPDQSADIHMISSNTYKFCPQPWVIEMWLNNPKLFD